MRSEYLSSWFLPMRSPWVHGVPQLKFITPLKESSYPVVSVGFRPSPTSCLFWPRAGDYSAIANPSFPQYPAYTCIFYINFFANKPFSNYPNLSEVPVSC